MEKKINLGCGTDYKEGFINIDASSTLPRVDKIINIGHDSLLSHFEPESINFILANDIVEHFFHWEAVKILKEIYMLLVAGGIAEIRVPNAASIIKNWRFPIEKQIQLLFGGQDIPQNINPDMDESRKKFPQCFCHKYAWTMSSMKKELQTIGFSKLKFKKAKTNFIVVATK